MLSDSLPAITNQAARARTSATFLVVLRGAFVLVLGGVGWGLANDSGISSGPLAGKGDVIVFVFTGIAMMVIALDVFVPRKSLQIMSGLFFGLVIGMVVAYGLSLIIDLLVLANVPGGQLTDSATSLLGAMKLALGVVCCYLAVSFILQTKDDVRFVIPYVEFAKETKGARPIVMDTSVIVDGRIADVAECSVLHSELVVPRFVLQELQTIADSNDKLKRIRGRRGLDILNKLQTSEKVDVRILDVKAERSLPDAGVDEMLVDLAEQIDGSVLTNDYNLNKVAKVRGITVININDLASALKPVVLPGESMNIKVIKPGESEGQGVGYLDDGTMVVVEGGREHLGENVEIAVTSVLQTSAGRMIFGRMGSVETAERRRARS